MRKKSLIYILSFCLLCFLIIGGSNALAKENSVEDFVTRFYVHILNRQPDSAGLSAWSENLRSGKEQGANVGYGFVQSPEFKKRNLNDEEYIKVLYRAFFDREADGGGLSAWKKVLDSGLSRMHVYKGFAESNEFTKVCARYGITRGSIKLTAPMDKNEGVTKFVARCYKLCLGRRADEDGLNAWCSQILSGANSAKQAAHGFVFSDEFKKKNLSNKEYVKVLYRVFMDREADSAGLNAWVKVLNEGRSRTHVFNGFADSNEFKKICDSYGIYAGEPSPPEVETWKKEYVKILADERKNTGAFFWLWDIDCDNIPELFIDYAYGGDLHIYSANHEKAYLLLHMLDEYLGQWKSFATNYDGKVAVYTKDESSLGDSSTRRWEQYDFYKISNDKLVLEDTIYWKNGASMCQWNGVSYDRAIFDKFADIYRNEYTGTGGCGLRDRPYYLDDFNAVTPEGEITVNNIEKYWTQPKNYLDMLTQYEEYYGKCRAIEVWSDFYMMSGLCFAKLIDFDNNGRNELVLVTGVRNPYGYDETQVYTMEVWAYENNKLKCLYSGDVCAGGDVGSRSVKFTNYNGRTYLMVGMSGAGDSFDFWGYKNGKFAVEQSVIIWDTEYSVNGVNVSQAEAERALQQWTQNAKFYDLCYTDSPYFPKPFDFKGLIAETKQQLGY